MSEENKEQKDTKNNTPEIEKIGEIPTMTSFIEGQIPQVKEMDEKEKHNKELFMIKVWLIALCIVFTCSMISGIYLVINPNHNNTQLVEEKSTSEQSVKFFKGSNSKEGAVVVNIRGEISESTDNNAFSSKQNASSIARRIRELADKKEVKALLLDINSPGGTVAAVQDIYNALNYFRSQKKPVVALMRDVAASGGFYIAMAADKIVR